MSTLPIHKLAQPGRGRQLTFAVLCLACLALIAGYTAWAMQRETAPSFDPSAGPVRLLPAEPASGAELRSQPSLLFSNNYQDDTYAKTSFVPLAEPGSTRAVTPLSCDRLYFAAGQGICLYREKGFLTQYWAVTFGEDFKPRHELELGGIISRARVSSDGRYGATTVFVSGHSYADAGFSTATNIIDMNSGQLIANLEEFAVEHNGASIHAPDFNYWGVTFAKDSNRFYATLASGGTTYLVEGDIATRRLRTLRENVECPSLSPDNTRIAFKKRVGYHGGPDTWRLHVLDLATMQETALAESNSVDDQAEWLDDSTVLYGHEGGIWSVPADGSGVPQQLLHKAHSPAVLR